MKTISIVVFLAMIACFNMGELKSQKLVGGFGCELNQTRFRQYAPTVKVEFENPHLPSLGLSVYGFLNCSLTSFISLQVAPLIGFYNTKSKVTDAFKMYIYGFRVENSVKYSKFRFEVGIEYNRLVKIFGTTYNNIKTDWTFFAHRRDFYGPTINIGYNVIDDANIYFRSTYFLYDFFSSGALDFDGNLVGPVEVTPYIFAIGIDYRFNMFDLKKINQKKGKLIVSN